MTNKYQTIWKSRHTLRVTRITQISHTKILKNKKQYLSRYGGPGTHVTQICHTKIKNIKEYVSRYGGPGTQAVSEQWGIGWDTYLARFSSSSHPPPHNHQQHRHQHHHQCHHLGIKESATKSNWFATISNKGGGIIILFFITCHSWNDPLRGQYENWPKMGS